MIRELRGQIETVQGLLLLAERAGMPYAAHLHRARLEDLVDMATRHGIDVSGWVDRSLLAPPATAEV